MLDKYSGILALVALIIGLIAFLKLSPEMQEDDDDEQVVQNDAEKALPLDLNDEDATVAALIASIECRNQYHKNVKVVSVRKVA